MRHGTYYQLWGEDQSERWWLKPVLIGLAVLLIIGLAYYAITYRAATRARVVSLTWMRAINIERWQVVQESDWSIPAGGRKTREYSAFHHWNHIYAGETCTKVGETRSCTANYIDYPVYETRYDYDIDRWVVVRTPTLRGDGHTATWPDVSDIHDAHNPPQIGDERAGQRISRYAVKLQGEKSYALDFTEERWLQFQPGAVYTVILNIFGQPLDVVNEAR